MNYKEYLTEKSLDGERRGHSINILFDTDNPTFSSDEIEEIQNVLERLKNKIKNYTKRGIDKDELKITDSSGNKIGIMKIENL